MLRGESTHTTPAGFWRLPDTDLALKIGGYVKLDVIHDFDEVGNPYKFATSTIGVPGSSDSTTTLHARESRLNVDLRGPLGEHEGRVFIEGDFFGEDNHFELRHAYGSVGGLLAGQTWTTYMDLSSRPHTLDFEGPDAEIFVRQALVRWTGDLTEGSTYSIAIEDSAYDVMPLGGATGTIRSPLPDIAANLRAGNDERHIQLAGVMRFLDFDGDAGTQGGKEIGWGVLLSARTQLGAASRRLMGQVSYGEGSAHYSQALRGTGSDAVIGPSGGLDLLPSWTAVVGLEHDWCEKWSSTAAYSIAEVDNSAAQDASAIHRAQSASVNLVWSPYERFLTGVEYLYGIRENQDGEDGDAHRLQFSFKFSF